MLKFNCNVQNRKDLVKRLVDLTNMESRYMGAPNFAYKIGPYTVEQDGTLAVDETDADMKVLSTLLAEGVIVGTLPTAQEHRQTPFPETTAGNPTFSEELPELTISLPLDGHTGVSLRNLVNLIYSRGPILSQATGGDFGIDKELLYILDAVPTPASAEEFRAMLNRYVARCGGVRGIQILEDRISFTGLGYTQDAAYINAYTELAARLNQMALTQKRIQAKSVNDENPKYAMHIFLIRLGFNGPDFKQERKILMEQLEGSQAFRTPAQAEKAKIKLLQKRSEQRGQEAISSEMELANRRRVIDTAKP